MTDGEEPNPSDRPSPRRSAQPAGETTRSRAEGNGAQPSPRRAPAGGKRRQGRVLALQLLYELDVAGHGVEEVLERTFVAQPAPAAVRAHVERLVRGVLADRAEIDPYIEAAAPAFPLPQLPTIDRNVLRLAIFELLREPAVPPKAAINEAVELAKQFGGDNSSRFVNGVLGTVVERVPRPAGATPPRGAASPASPAPGTAAPAGGEAPASTASEPPGDEADG